MTSAGKLTPRSQGILMYPFLTRTVNFYLKLRDAVLCEYNVQRLIILNKLLTQIKLCMVFLGFPPAFSNV
jgi:hypothetical protein